MEVSHVIRGEEWLPSAPLHVLLYRALAGGYHARVRTSSLLLKPDGNGKLSKRDGDRLGFLFSRWNGTTPRPVKCLPVIVTGYLPEAVINFLALLGWNPGNDQELMSLDELVKLFDLHRCSKAGAKIRL